MRTVTALAALLALSGPVYADVLGQAQTSVGASQAAATAGSDEEAKNISGMAVGDSGAVTPVPEGQGSASGKAKPALTADAKTATLKTNAPPPPSILKKTGSTIKGWADSTGSFLKKHIGTIAGAGVGAGVGLAAAHVLGAGLLGAGLAGAGVGAAAALLAAKGQTGPAVGVACFGLAGLVLGGPIGALIGAAIGGGGAWAIGKFLYS